MEDSSPVAGAGVDIVGGKESTRTSDRSRICVEMA